MAGTGAPFDTASGSSNPAPVMHMFGFVSEIIPSGGAAVMFVGWTMMSDARVAWKGHMTRQAAAASIGFRSCDFMIG